MAEEIFEVRLWFNSNKNEKRETLLNPNDNSGVGLNIINDSSIFFDPNMDFVSLIFDNGTTGRARVKKNSWNTCTHLISNSIGAWARGNGLWSRKLNEREVPVNICVLRDFEEYYIFT